MGKCRQVHFWWAVLKILAEKSTKFLLYARVPKTSSARRHCRPESFCASGKFLRVFTKLDININLRVNNFLHFPECLESFSTVWKVSGKSGKFPESMESFRRVWKVSGQSGKFPDSLESFQTVWKLSRQFGKFPDSLARF